MSSRDTRETPEDTIAAEHEAALARLPAGPEADEVLRQFLELKARDPVLPLPVTVLEDAAEDLAESTRRAKQHGGGKQVRDTKPRPIGKAVVGAGLGRATDPRLEAEFVSRNTKPVRVGPALAGFGRDVAEGSVSEEATPPSRSRSRLGLVALVLLATIGLVVVIAMQFKSDTTEVTPTSGATSIAMSEVTPNATSAARPSVAVSTAPSVAPPSVSVTASSTPATPIRTATPFPSTAPSVRPSATAPPATTQHPTAVPSSTNDQWYP
ncbi:MAG: hypothetical protein ABIO72_02480 [Patescibacteria group bacterium]